MFVGRDLSALVAERQVRVVYPNGSAVRLASKE
jgi:hypothetical protein